MADSYSVSQVNTYIKNMFQTDFLLRQIKVSGEVSNCKYHSSGHIYFTLKDEGASLTCVMFARDRGGLDFKLSDGMKVVALGSITVYERDGKYQLYVRNIKKDGQGVLYERFLALKDELESMGMFDAMYKKPIPKYAKKVGVVTASTGAAIQDIINITTRRNPYVQLYLYPAKVQGEGAEYTICKGIEYLDTLNLDVIIVGRGGGSIEDLWAFNEECVAKTVFNCNTPVISAVGHETDFTIIDFVSDLRAPTPSAAAEMAVFDVHQIEDYIDKLAGSLDYGINNRLYNLRKQIDNINARLKLLSPTSKLDSNRQYLDILADRLNSAIDHSLKMKRNKFELLAGKMSALSPLAKISGGFGYVVDSNGIAVKSIDSINVDDDVKIRLSDGSFDAKINNITRIK